MQHSLEPPDEPDEDTCECGDPDDCTCGEWDPDDYNDFKRDMQDDW